MHFAHLKVTRLTFHMAQAVTILSIIRSEKGSFPPSTIIIEQYRPPIGKFIIGEPFLYLNLSKRY